MQDYVVGWLAPSSAYNALWVTPDGKKYRVRNAYSSPGTMCFYMEDATKGGFAQFVLHILGFDPKCVILIYLPL